MHCGASPSHSSAVSTPCKQLEHCISSCLHFHLDEHSWIKHNQHGFRRMWSRVTQLLTTTTDLYRALETGIRTDAIILDFSKALDKVDHECLLQKLQSVGIERKLLHWMRHYLTGRTQRVCIHLITSEDCKATPGVPQGSVLGPLMLIIFINDIGNGIAENTTIRPFADDALIYQQIKSHKVHVELQDHLNRLVDWAAAWRMEFNPTMWYVMHFMTKYQKRTTCAAPVLWVLTHSRRSQTAST